MEPLEQTLLLPPAGVLSPIAHILAQPGQRRCSGVVGHPGCIPRRCSLHFSVLLSGATVLSAPGIPPPSSAHVTK